MHALKKVFPANFTAITKVYYMNSHFPHIQSLEQLIKAD